MIEQLAGELPLPQRLALAYAPKAVKEHWLSLLALDARLGAIVRQTKEPILGQMRLAWWRELIEKPERDRPGGDPLVGLLGCWRGEERALSRLVDGWEALLASETLSADQITAYAEARAEPYTALVRIGDAREREDAVRKAATIWVLADLASGLSDQSERECALAVAGAVDRRYAVAVRSFRPLAVLAGLGARALRRGGGALLMGPTDLFAAARLGMIGR